jgi:hypothetical protein
MDHETVPKTVKCLRLVNDMPAHQTLNKQNLENMQNKQNMQNMQKKRNMQNMYLCCLFPAKKSREGEREGVSADGGAVRVGGMLLGVLMERVAGPLGRSQGSPKQLLQSER